MFMILLVFWVIICWVIVCLMWKIDVMLVCISCLNVLVGKFFSGVWCCMLVLFIRILIGFVFVLYVLIVDWVVL